MIKMIEDEEGEEEKSNSKVQRYSLYICFSMYLLANNLLSTRKHAFYSQGVINNIRWDTLRGFSFKERSLVSQLKRLLGLKLTSSAVCQI